MIISSGATLKKPDLNITPPHVAGFSPYKSFYTVYARITSYPELLPEPFPVISSR